MFTNEEVTKMEHSEIRKNLRCDDNMAFIAYSRARERVEAGKGSDFFQFPMFTIF